MHILPLVANSAITSVEIETPHCTVVVTERDGNTEIEIKSQCNDNTLLHTIRASKTTAEEYDDEYSVAGESQRL